MKLGVSGRSVFLLAWGVLAPAQTVTISPLSLPFGSQTIGTTSAPQTATLTNNGSTTVTITKISLTGSSNEYAQSNNCGSTVAVGASCTFTVTFTPAYAVMRSGTISVSDNAPGSPQKVALSGTGALPAVKLTPANVIFAKQAVGTTSTARNVILMNSGSTALNITSIAASPNSGKPTIAGRRWPRGRVARFPLPSRPLRSGRVQARLRSPTALPIPRRSFLLPEWGRDMALRP